MKTSWTVCACVALVSMGGCTDEKREPEITHKTFILLPPAAELAQHAESRPEHTARCVVDPRIQSACGIAEPKFDFDSANVQLDAQLDQLAKCFTEGPMKGQHLNLIGRTDPRGDARYNLELGRERAKNVAAYLEDRGVSGLRVATETRGEQGAVGVDEQGWSEDRRVDIMLED
ncbi:MAG: OmpA family protein [Polyangiaceae bacterium]